jgi:hypothetical protein
MADFKLRVRFQGHCSFAPKHDGKEAMVFLLNESWVHQERPNDKIAPHHAALTVDARYLSASGTGVPGELVLFLNQRRVRFVPPVAAQAPPPLEIEGFADLGTPKQPSLVRKPNDRGFWWLAPLETACSARGLQAGGGYLESVFTAPKLTKENARLLGARVEISTGMLGVSEFLKSGDDYIVWRFRSFGGAAYNQDHFQILAGEMLLEQEVDGDRVVIETVSLVNPDDPNERRELVLFPRDDGDGSVVDVVILNEEGDEYMPNRAGIPAVLRNPRDRDRIFEEFYKVVKNPPPPDEAPMPVADYVVRKDGAVNREPAQSAPPCSPSRLEVYY